MRARLVDDDSCRASRMPCVEGGEGTRCDAEATKSMLVGVPGWGQLWGSCPPGGAVVCCWWGRAGCRAKQGNIGRSTSGVQAGSTRPTHFPLSHGCSISGVRKGDKTRTLGSLARETFSYWSSFRGQDKLLWEARPPVLAYPRTPVPVYPCIHVSMYTRTPVPSTLVPRHRGPGQGQPDVHRRGRLAIAGHGALFIDLASSRQSLAPARSGEVWRGLARRYRGCANSIVVADMWTRDAGTCYLLHPPTGPVRTVYCFSPCLTVASSPLPMIL